MHRRLYPLLAALALLAPIAVQAAPPNPVPVLVESTPLPPQAECSGRFVAHDLEHTTATADGLIQMFEANGSGLAAGDLDNDGDQDLVLGNLDGPNTLLWNEGGLRFRRAPFGADNTRSITVVDVDADGWLDIVLTLNTGTLNYWHNEGDGSFQQRILPGVGHRAYSLNWGDFDQDGDLDLVTATYDAGFLSDVGNEYRLRSEGGVTVYENRDGRFRPTRLASEAQALALLLFDVDGDGRLDILVGNDFNPRDMAFRNTPHGWARDGWTAPTWDGPVASAKTPFAQTTHSTMNLDAGDVHNDGRLEVFASDMKPVDPTNPAVAIAWAPVMANAKPPQRNGVPDPYDPQVMENVLLVRDDSDIYYNVGRRANVDATGWSWAGRFGDLDLDGYLDLYVVNGFAEKTLMGHIEGHELIEENQALRNNGMGRFTPMPEWGLASTRGGRSMLMADLDGDGDLDIVVNNLRAPAQLFENQLCRTGSAVEMELAQPGAQNRKAIGATVRVYTSDGVLTREVRAAAGYMTGEPALIHFGLAPSMQVRHVEIVWPDGGRTTLDALPLDARVTVTRQP